MCVFCHIIKYVICVRNVLKEFQSKLNILLLFSVLKKILCVYYN